MTGCLVKMYAKVELSFLIEQHVHLSLFLTYHNNVNGENIHWDCYIINIVWFIWINKMHINLHCFHITIDNVEDIHLDGEDIHQYSFITCRILVLFYSSGLGGYSSVFLLLVGFCKLGQVDTSCLSNLSPRLKKYNGVQQIYWFIVRFTRTIIYSHLVRMCDVTS